MIAFINHTWKSFLEEANKPMTHIAFVPRRCECSCRCCRRVNFLGGPA